MSNCVLCGKILNNEIFHMENMPSKVQHLLKADEIEDDKGMNLHLYECDGCGLVQFDCQAVSYYKDVIRAVGLSDTMKKLRIDQYKRVIDKYALSGKTVWEVGCGGGEFLGLWEGLGVSYFGVENNPDLVKKAKNSGLDVEQGFVDAGYISSKGPFDVFVSFNYLEHQPDPKGMVEGIYNNLKVGGIGLVTVPSFEYFIEKASYYEFMRDHIVYYTEEALSNLFRMNGFEVCEISRFNGDTTEIIVRKRRKLELPDFNSQRDYISNCLNEFVREHDDIENIAVWGASHQGLTMLATLNMDFSIDYIIDSSPMKWDRYSTVSHLKIVKPEKAYTDNPDLVIIMAPAFSQEIADQIRQHSEDIKYVLAIKDDKVLIL